ncbi:glycerol-3-phosphate dehydrogenase [Angomonas deanei]|nr:glycerol-3-phosphate dehydrogenase [Angomonas deanei]|eukprot:EPY29427.1 glycerol-3-phosphate dehydrogenase [Angomonas deanei]
MASLFKIALAGGTVGFCGLVGFTYTNPSYTQRKFNPTKCPPFKFDHLPSRDDCVESLKSHNSPDHPLDVLVVGGGSVGSGVALDATLRGLTVGLVEMNDYASGTSSKSTKLIHGGIRYLEKAVFQLDPGQLMLVAEALRERTIMIHQAPHLCHSLPTLIPCYHPYDAGLYWIGTKVYDIIAAMFGGTLEYSGFVAPYEVLKDYPILKTTDGDNSPLLGAVRYFDGQMNDARLNYAVAMTAASYGASTVNYAKLVEMKPVTDGPTPLVKCTIVDRKENKTFEVYTRSIVNAGGPFTGEVEKLVEKEARHVNMVPSLGTHIVIDRKYCPKTQEAMIVPSSDGRVVFAIPWQGGCLLGTTDHKCEVTELPQPSQSDVDFLVKNIEPFTGPVPSSAVLSAWSGIRPLAAPQNIKSGATENISREHLITIDEGTRVLNIVGGKWTTYRKMSEDAVDKLCGSLLADKKVKACVTPEVVLYGARRLESVPAAPRAVPLFPRRSTITGAVTMGMPSMG